MGIQWWAYLHTNGTIQVKRYFSPRDFEDARESPFVRKITKAFDAEGREDALKKAQALLGL